MPRIHRLALLVFALSLVPATEPCPAKTLDFPRRAIDAEVNATIAAHQFNGVVLAIVRDGAVYRQAYGICDVQKGQPCVLASRFEIGSITKEATAAAILQLVEAGRLSLDEKLSRYVPTAPHAGQITIRQLLSLTSGLPEYIDGPNILDDIRHRATNEQLLERIRDKPLAFRPGTQWQHCNTNYLLLGMVIQAVAHEPYQRYVFEHVLAKAGPARFATIEDEPALADMARGYMNGKPSPPIDSSWLGAAGNLVTNIDGMLAWDAALDAGKVVSGASLAKMRTLQTPRDAEMPMGLGLFVDRHAGQQRVWMEGTTLGYAAADHYYPLQRTRVIVLTNKDGNDGAIHRLAEQVFDSLQPIPAGQQDRPHS